MRDKLTIFVPTFKRHHLLDRVLPYLVSLDVSLLVIDSTPERYEGIGRFPDVRYIHCPELNIYEKLRTHVVGGVKTPYLLMNADDMFPSESALREGVAFLEAHSDYSSILGDALGHKDGSYCFAYSQNHYLAPTDAPRPSARLLQHFAWYCPMTYSIQRTDCWEKGFQSTPEEIVNYNLSEFFYVMMMLIHGKAARVPGFYHVTDMVPSINFSSKKYRGTTKDMTTNPDYYVELEAIKRVVSEYLLEREDLEPRVARRYVEAALDMYLARILPSRLYYWLNQRPPRTWLEKQKKNIRKILLKMLNKRTYQEMRRAEKADAEDRLSQAVAASIVGRESDFERIRKILS